MASQFTSQLWESISPIYAAILAHPFMKGLTSGDLPEETFRFYVIQDALYLRDYARCLTIAAAKSPDDRWCEMFAEHARGALVVERSLHEGFFAQWGLTEADLSASPPAPTNLAYTSYLLRIAYGHAFEELLGAVLPCYWIYWEVGKTLQRIGSASPTYQRWIDTYGSEDFGSVVRQVLDVTNDAVADLPESRRLRIREHFVTTSRYEWLFWDAAYRQERWPV